MMKRIVLASQSPRRKQLLEQAEINFEVIVVPTDESYPDDLESAAIPIHIARQKAIAVQNKLLQSEQREGLVIIAADTVVILDEKIIGKPRDREDAIEILQSLNGKQHRVITGVVLLTEDKEIAFGETTFVQFHTLTQEQIVYYVDKYEPYDKAGAYAIQEWIGIVGIEYIKGDFYNVMGLPISKVIQYFQRI